MTDNRLWPKGAEKILSKLVDFSTDAIKAILLSADYTFDASHSALVNIPSSARVSGPKLLTSPAVASGVFDAADAVFSAVTGATVVAVAIYASTGGSTSAPLIAFFGTSITNVPFTPNGGNVNMAFNVSGIFSLANVG